MSFDNKKSPNFKPPINLVTTSNLLHQNSDSFILAAKCRIQIYVFRRWNVNYVKHSRSKEMVNAFMVIG